MNIFKRGLILVTLTIFASSLQGAIPSAERQVLIALYNATGGDSWTNNSGWRTPPLDADGFAMPGTENTWFGISTGALNTTLTGINLSSNNLIGGLPSEIGSLPNLTALNLHTNHLSGSIPSSLGDLANLTLLYLYENEFAGTLPAELGGLSNLTTLALYDNQLSGSIPSSLGNLNSLQSLLLHFNQFEGSLPAELGGLTNLVALNCHSNLLTGSIPTSFGGLTSLQQLRLHANSLSGSIPAELGSLANLQEIYLNDNDIEGSIPASLGNLSNLQRLYLEDNVLDGPIPAALGGLTNLVELSLHHNGLDGPIPPELGGMTSLVILALQYNQLSGSIPAELGGLAGLHGLYLHENQLTGSIPTELGDLSSLVDLWLDTNQLTGTIPVSFGGLTHLVTLRLHENQLTGTIPAELGAVTSLAHLSLSINRLTGTIPGSLGNLSNLQYLYLNGNGFDGPVPEEITNLTALIPSTGTGIGYNALYSSDPAVVAFLDAKDPDWASTQTVAPSGMTATPLDGANILVSWLPIAYTEHGGYYALFSSATAGGEYTFVGQTSNKAFSSLQVNGLTPGQTHYFVVRTHTDAHAGNLSALDSEYSEEVSATAWTQVQVRVAGTVLVGGSAPLANVVMAGLPGNPATDAFGVYDVTVAAGWSGTVTPTLAGYSFDPSFKTYSVLTVNQLGQDYAATVISGPSITVNSPNGGETWAVGSAHAVTWTQTDVTGSVTIDLYKGGVYQKTLGTAEGTAGTFSWMIATSETVGTDYMVRVWQGSVSDDSNGDFAVLRAAKKVDLNGDGQEDILWRYYGTGAYQGLNVVWLMNQTETLPLIPMATSQSEPRGTSLLAGTPAETAYQAPLRGGNPGISSQRRSFKTILESGADIALDPMKIMDSPLDHPLDRSATRHGQVRDREFLNVPIRKDAADTNALGSGTTELAALQLNTEVILSSVADTNWEIAGTGDFDGDGDTDILWRYYGAGDYQGLNDIWFMNGTLFDGESVFSQVQDTNWKIVGTGDFNGDGDTDILWRYYGTGDYQGLNVVWFMNGPEFAGETVFSAVTDTSWRVAGTGDFNSDGETDILWRYHGTGDYQGLNVIWFMNDATFVAETVFSAVTDTNWEIAGTGDFNNDGHVDILWRYYGTGAYQGMNDIWYMNGTTFVSEEVFTVIPDTSWRIVNR